MIIMSSSGGATTAFFGDESVIVFGGGTVFDGLLQSVESRDEDVFVIFLGGG